MSDSEAGETNPEPTTASGAVPEVAPALSKQLSRAGRIARAAEGARSTLLHSLPSDEEAQSELRNVIAELLLAQEQLAEWGRLHHLLHEVLAASAPFHAGLASVLEGDQLGPTERHALHMSWRPCQQRINALVDFCEGIKHIGRPYIRDAHELRGARCAVDIVSVQLMLEDTLTDERPHTQALVELADDFQTACHRHLAVADREMQVLIDLLQGVSAALLWGLS